MKSRHDTILVGVARLGFLPGGLILTGGFCDPRLALGGLLVLIVLARSALAEPALAEPALAEPAVGAGAERVDFARDIKPILSNKCYFCHGPDAAQRKGGSEGLRLDTQAGATADLGGYAAIAPGNPEKSALVSRVCSSDADEVMPPLKSGKKLLPREIDLLRDWVRQGGVYTSHWSYTKPVRPAPPAVHAVTWPRNDIDRFILARLEREGLAPSAQADRYSLARRVSLDLTGLPPTLEEVDQFVGDSDPQAYEKLVDRLLAKPAYGERWAQAWLDLARYADSAGYADDPERTIWAYRDYVIRSFNSNKPFDRFTVEQLAGDLLPDAGQEQVLATAFHRNTPTNSEGGTDDEEFRNVAIVDRVNTTFAVWMGTTMACAQCHHHKYDPISQEEYFQIFALFNNTEDADRRDESPVLTIYGPAEQRQRDELLAEQTRLRQALATPTPELTAAAQRWAAAALANVRWQTLEPITVTSAAGSSGEILPEGVVRIAPAAGTSPAADAVALAGAAATGGAAGGAAAGSVTVEAAAPQSPVRALRLETLPEPKGESASSPQNKGQIKISRVEAAVTLPANHAPRGRYVRIELPGKERFLSLAEVEVFVGTDNVAPGGAAQQSSTDFSGPAELAIDRNTNGDYNAKSTTHTKISENPWWEVDLRSEQAVDRIVLWNRTDSNLQSRLNGCRVSLLGDARQVLWEASVAVAPQSSVALATSSLRIIDLSAAVADSSGEGQPSGEQPANGAAPEQILKNPDPAKLDWRLAVAAEHPHALVLLSKAPVEITSDARLVVTLSIAPEGSPDARRPTLGRFRLSVSADERAFDLARVPADVQESLRAAAPSAAPAGLSADQRERLTRMYLPIASELDPVRKSLAEVERRVGEIKPSTAPVMRELTAAKRRKTHLQHRGNFLDLGQELSPGLPAAFPPPSAGAPVDRLALARWLVDNDNPLTARVTVNRFWEQLFGVGLVATCEEFGSQGELPSHPELLDWLARDFVDSGWNVKAFLKLLVTSATYRQSSRVAGELAARDPDNRRLARGPRFRLSAEMVRDQALFASGLLSAKLYGPPVRPMQPSSGLSAAFGGATDWRTSVGEDRYRRALYTTWRRSSPYPSMSTFDAPNREVCTVRRTRTNTPLQALVTLNDPVYVEAAQALARRMLAAGAAPGERIRQGFRLCVSRFPSDAELARLTRLYEGNLARFESHSDDAMRLATDPLGPLPAGAKPSELAALVVVGNVLLNLDELLLKR